MRALGSLPERLGRNDMLHVFTLYLFALVLVLATRWPSEALPVNESWFSLAPARLALLQLIALAYGAHRSTDPPVEQRLTLMALALFVVVSIPFDVLTYAASYPVTPLAWSLTVPFLNAAAYFGLGLLLGRLAGLARLRSLLPILVPALVIAGIWLDVRLQLTLFNPFVAAVQVAPAHAVLMLAATVLTIAFTLRRGPRPDGVPA